MIIQKIPYFDIAQICDSGQCFRMWEKQENVYRLYAADRYLEITKQGDTHIFHCSDREFEQCWKSYFDLDEDYGRFRSKIGVRDRYLQAAAQRGSGIRILRQELWETIVSFLISQQNNIKRIRRSIDEMCRKFGREMHTSDGEIYYAFPSPDVLAVLPDDGLMECGLGYRSKYVVQTARDIVSGKIDLDRIRKMSEKKAKNELKSLYGVGEKVADCICLFALHQLDAFPIDTHIRQALEKHYPKGFPEYRYRGCKGIMQQYIFYYELTGAKQ